MALSLNSLGHVSAAGHLHTQTYEDSLLTARQDTRLSGECAHSLENSKAGDVN